MTPAILVIVAMIVLAAWAYWAVAPGAEKIPMQWSLRGNVNWSAPRLMAFAFVPVLAIAISILITASGLNGADALLLPICILFGCQILYIVLVRRWSAARRA